MYVNSQLNSLGVIPYPESYWSIGLIKQIYHLWLTHDPLLEDSRHIIVSIVYTQVYL